MKPAFLRRAWVPWTLALLLAAGSVGAMAWLGSERDDLLRQTAEAREDLADARSRIDAGRERIEELETRAELAIEALRECAAAYRSERALLTLWIDHLAASRDENFDLAEQIYDRIDPVWKDANRTARRCQNKGTEAGGFA